MWGSCLSDIFRLGMTIKVVNNCKYSDRLGGFGERRKSEHMFYVTEGEEGSEVPPEEEIEEEVEAESVLTEYDADDFVSEAVTSPESTIPIDMFDFEYPFLIKLHGDADVFVINR